MICKSPLPLEPKKLNVETVACINLHKSVMMEPISANDVDIVIQKTRHANTFMWQNRKVRLLGVGTPNDVRLSKGEWKQLLPSERKEKVRPGGGYYEDGDRYFTLFTNYITGRREAKEERNAIGYLWSFQTALTKLGNPSHIIIYDLDC